MADKTDVNEIIDKMKSSIMALNETMKMYNFKIIDSFKVFQNLDTVLNNLTENLNTDIKNVSENIQDFGKKLKEFTLPSLKQQTPDQTTSENTKSQLTDFPSESLGLFEGNLKDSLESLKNFKQDLSDNTSNLKDFGSELKKLSQAVTSATKSLSSLSIEGESSNVKSPSVARKKESAKAGDTPPPIPKENKAANGKAGGAGGALGGMAGAANGVMAAFKFVTKVVEIGMKSIAAYNAVILSSIVVFQAFTNRVKSYVQAYNPNLVKQFDYVLKDITAVIGKALQPALIALGAALRQLGDILVPVMDALMPAFQSLAKAIGSFLLPVFNALGNALTNAAPIINKLAAEFAKLAGELGEVIGENLPLIISYLVDYLKNWIETLKAYKNVAGPFIAIWTTFNRAFLQAGNILLGAFNWFSDGMKKVAGKLRSWLDWFGITKPGKNYVGGAKVEPAKQGNSTGMAAREAEYMNVEDLSRGLIKAAYGSGQDIQRQQLEQQQMMNGQLAEINQKLGRANIAPQAVQPGLRMA